MWHTFSFLCLSFYATNCICLCPNSIKWKTKIVNLLTVKLTLVCSCFILKVPGRRSFCVCETLCNNNVVISFRNRPSHRPCKFEILSLFYMVIYPQATATLRLNFKSFVRASSHALVRPCIVIGKSLESSELLLILCTAG